VSSKKSRDLSLAQISAAGNNLAVPEITAELLAKWRAAQGLSQEALGERLNPPMSPSQYRGYESGKSSPTVRQLLKLVRALHLPGDTDQELMARFFLGPDEPEDKVRPQSDGQAGGVANARLFRTRAAAAIAIEQAHITREEIADRLGLSLNELLWVEQGMRSLTLVQFRTLCELLGLSADELLELPMRLPSEVADRLEGLESLFETLLKDVQTTKDLVRQVRG
jgi:transcriptional regulator with XRE-family HTH domain